MSVSYRPELTYFGGKGSPKIDRSVKMSWGGGGEDWGEVGGGGEVGTKQVVPKKRIMCRARHAKENCHNLKLKTEHA